jgi:hypothetical protein
METITKSSMSSELALLHAYKVNLSSIKTPEILQRIEDEVNQAFDRMRFEPPPASSQSGRSTSTHQEY